jgi:hypothetical protein
LRGLRAKLPADAFDLIALRGQLRDDTVSVVALNLDHALFDRAAGAAAFFELGADRRQRGIVEREPRDCRDARTLAALGLSTNTNNPVAEGASRVVFTDTHRLAAVWAETTFFGGVDKSHGGTISHSGGLLIHAKKLASRIVTQVGGNLTTGV